MISARYFIIAIVLFGICIVSEQGDAIGKNRAMGDSGGKSSFLSRRYLVVFAQKLGSRFRASSLNSSSKSTDYPLPKVTQLFNIVKNSNDILNSPVSRNILTLEGLKKSKDLNINFSQGNGTVL